MKWGNAFFPKRALQSVLQGPETGQKIMAENGVFRRPSSAPSRCPTICRCARLKFEIWGDFLSQQGRSENSPAVHCRVFMKKQSLFFLQLYADEADKLQFAVISQVSVPLSYQTNRRKICGNFYGSDQRQKKHPQV